MANIRIKDLPSDTAPSKTDTVPIDLGTTRHATVEEIVLAGRPTATKTEAEAGIDPKKAMTPLTTKQAIDAQVAPNFVHQSTRVSSGTGLTGGAELTGNVTLSLNAASIASLANADSAVQPSRTLTAGTGLSGLGDLSADRTVSLNQSSIDSLSRADSAIQAPGGTTGQILFKESNLENHVSWRSIAAATAVSYTPQVLSDAEKSQARANIDADKVYNSVSDVQSSVIDNSVIAIRTNGYYAAGDGGAALYKRAATEPAHAGKIQSADGAWWELVTDVANVKMFGAKGDGVSDDHPAIQAAINFAQAVGVGRVFIPNSAGSYLLNSTIINDCSTPLTIEGAGRGLSKIKGGVGVNPVIKIGNLSEYKSTPQRVMDLDFDYPADENSSHIRAEACVLDVFNISTQGGKRAISLDEVFSFCISDCSFGNSRGSAIFSATIATGHNSRITSNGFFGCGNMQGTAAIYILSSDNVLISQNQIEGCYRAFEIAGCTAVRIVSNYMEYGHDPFYLGVSSRRNSSVIVEGNWIAAYDNPTYIEHVDGLFFRGNTIWNQTIVFAPAANSSNICIGQNTLLDGGIINNPPWTLLTTVNGWSGAVNPPAVNATADGQVSIRGGITRASGDGNQVCFVLPDAFRPRTEKRLIALNNSGGIIIVVISTNGNVYVEPGAAFTGTIYMDITFLR